MVALALVVALINIAASIIVIKGALMNRRTAAILLSINEAMKENRR